ncbi:hypothetical protein DFJ74DRAFT_688752 [Hyaloraphidium curvatum]|nr:hypothetical protein DFJ74DRAFT_688752 [Hyaloraphidium curvatum]
MRRFGTSALAVLVFAPIGALSQAVPFWPGGYGYTFEEVWSYAPAGGSRYLGLGASSTRVYADRVSGDGASVDYDVIDAANGRLLASEDYKDGYKTSLICGRSNGFTAAGGMFDGIQFRPQGGENAFGWAINMRDNAAYQNTIRLNSYIRPTLDAMGCEDNVIYPAYCNMNYNQQSGELAAGAAGECMLDSYDATTGANRWTAKWKAGDYATAGSVLVTPNTIWVAGVANNIEGNHDGSSKAMHPYLVKLSKGGDVLFTRFYPQYTAQAQINGKNILGMNTNGGLFMVVGGSVVSLDQANGDVLKSFTVFSATTGSVVAVPRSSDFFILPHNTPAQPRAFDVDGNVIQLRMGNPNWERNIVSIMINPANLEQAFITTPTSVSLVNLRKAALADDNAGYNPTAQTATSSAAATRTATASASASASRTSAAVTSAAASSATSRSAAATSSAAAATSSAAATTTSAAAPEATTTRAAVATTTGQTSASFKLSPAGMLYTVLGAVAAMLAF